MTTGSIEQASGHFNKAVCAIATTAGGLIGLRLTGADSIFYYVAGGAGVTYIVHELTEGALDLVRYLKPEPAASPNIRATGPATQKP